MGVNYNPRFTLGCEMQNPQTAVQFTPRFTHFTPNLLGTMLCSSVGESASLWRFPSFSYPFYLDGVKCVKRTPNRRHVLRFGISHPPVKRCEMFTATRRPA